MRLLVIQNGRQRFVGVKTLRDGAIGNLDTLGYAVSMIREDVALDVELRRFAQGLIENCPAGNFDCEVGRLFEFAQSIRFVRDPIDVDRLADAATTIAERAGDCMDKAVLLCSMLGTIGYITRLVAVNFYGDLATHGYDHLYLEVRRDDGSWEALDATPENAPMGWEAGATDRTVFDIWPGTSQGQFGGSVLDQLIGQGIQIGSQYVAGAIHQGQVTAAQQDAIGRQFDNFDHALASVLTTLHNEPVISGEQWQAALQGYAQLSQFASQNGGVHYVASQWQNEGPRYETWLQSLQAKVAGANVGVSAVAPGNTSIVAASGWLSNPAVLIVAVLIGLLLRGR